MVFGQKERQRRARAEEEEKLRKGPKGKRGRVRGYAKGVKILRVTRWAKTRNTESK